MKSDAILKIRVYALAVMCTSLIVYLEWGNNSRSFLIEGEIEFFRKLFTEPSSVLHPFTLIPLLGQILLIYSMIIPSVNRWYTYIGISCLAVLILFILFIGIMEGNAKMILSILPFLLFSTLSILHLRKIKKYQD
jgi:hypothetical protein